MSRRALFIWPVIILFLNQLVSFTKQAQSFSLPAISSDLWSVSIFQYMAWYVVFRLIQSSEPAPAACRGEFAAIVILCLFVYLPAAQTIWIAGLGIAICLCIFNKGDAKLRAAGIVLAALSVQEFWGHYLFNLAAPPLLRAETAIVGTVLQIFRPGTVWQDNVLTGPNGFGITVYTGCSSFHNFSLALLCWLTISQFRNQDWRSRDLAIGAGIGGIMILLNIFRLCLMSPNIDQFRYWHDGVGSQIFAIGASLVIVCVSLYGSRPASATQ